MLPRHPHSGVPDGHGNGPTKTTRNPNKHKYHHQGGLPESAPQATSIERDCLSNAHTKGEGRAPIQHTSSSSGASNPLARSQHRLSKRERTQWVCSYIRRPPLGVIRARVFVPSPYPLPRGYKNFVSGRGVAVQRTKRRNLKSLFLWRLASRRAQI
jgi:hypothetical protein